MKFILLIHQYGILNLKNGILKNIFLMVSVFVYFFYILLSPIKKKNFHIHYILGIPDSGLNGIKKKEPKELKKMSEDSNGCV